MKDEDALLGFLDLHAIVYQRVEHPAVFTVEESLKKVPPLNGARTKNLFLRDRKGENHFLVTMPFDKTVDLKSLAEEIGVRQLGFASPERLRHYLGIKPGSVSVLAAINDAARSVQVCLDTALRDADSLQVHPLVNTATLVIGLEDLIRFLELSSHEVTWIEVPTRHGTTQSH